MRRGRTRSLGWIWAQFKPYHIAAAGLCAGMMALSVLQVLLAVLTRYTVDTGLAGDKRFFWLGGALLGALLLLVLLRAALTWAAGSLSDRSAARLRYALLDAVEHSSGEQRRQFSSGVFLNRGMEDVKVLCEAVTGLLPATLGNLTRLIGAFGILAVFYLPLAGVLAAACAAAGAGAVCLRPVLQRCHSQVRGAEERAFSGMQEYAQQLELLQALGAEEESLRRYRGLLEESLAAKKRRRAWSLTGSAAMSLLTQVGTGCLLLWGIYSIRRGALSYGALTSILQLLALFRSPVTSLSGLWGRIAAVEVSAGRLRELLEPENGAAEEEPQSPRPTQALAAVFEDVTFRYKDSEPPVLEHYSARFDLTGWVCLSGMSGRGKTTIFRLLLGLCRPQSGRVYLETDCGEVPCGRDTRHLFAYVPQDFTLFSGSVRENLLLAAPDADNQACSQALETAQARFIWGLRAGMETQVKEQRAGLSMGQLQRIAIARAVLMERPILLLDECTSALDSQTALAVLAALRSLGGGAVLVTHRPEVISGMNNVLSVDGEETV